MDPAYDQIGKGAFCPACYTQLLQTHVVRVDATRYVGDCTCCGRASHVTMHCRYTMKGKEKMRRNLI